MPIVFVMWRKEYKGQWLKNNDKTRSEWQAVPQAHPFCYVCLTEQPGTGDLSHRQTSHKQGPGPSVEMETSTEQGRGDDTHCLRLSIFSSRGQQKVQLRHFDIQRQDQGWKKYLDLQLKYK